MPAQSSSSAAMSLKALTRARDALLAEPAGLISDFDGTLSPIVADPRGARAAEGALDALRLLSERLAVVGIVTGRAASDARRIVPIPSLLVVGNHGLEWLEPHAAAPRPAPDLDDAAARVGRAVAHVPATDGVWVEGKGLSATVHYRNAADPAAARNAIHAALEPVARAEALHLRHGRMSIELRPVGLGDKGTALRSIAERYRLRGLVVMGDDVTDLDMFTAAADLRTRGVLRAAILAVVAGDEVPARVAEAADAAIDGPAGVVRLLAELAG
jgi:trehalose 6-phosphate phosphatase